MSTFRRSRSRAAAVLATTLVASLAACGGDDGDGGGDADALTVWIVEDLPDRVAATQAVVDDFAADSGVDVELVAVAEDQFNQVLTSNAAAGDLPDVIGALPLGQVRTLSANELVDTAAVGEVIDNLDAATFSESALELTADGDSQLAVPSESWVQLLVYRKDLFDKAGLAAPETYDDVLAAAEELDSSDVAGFVGANVAGDAFTAQTFEEIGLGNDCEMVDDAGEVTLDSDECVEALEFYNTLQQDYSVNGAQDVDTTRASYFAGQAAMLIWSSFILDELAGLRDDALPTCEECTGDKAFLAENSGVVTAIQGPSGSEPKTYGEVTSWTITPDSADSATQFVEYMMTDGYEPWIAIAPEGKIPVRSGDSAGATDYADAWAKMKVGVDTKAPLSDFYGPDVLEALTSGTDTLQRWAIPQGQGDLLGAIQGEQPVANAVNEAANGTSPDEAAKQAADAIRAVQDSL
ncbi:ABC transporter substrate-binding protein [Nocardioides sp. zg-1228]|uniref:ABC transporter substrate-binding protein n=1 Tax=Nocardioides sp. zg-1228 TaxID=2763008 RepID=UPI0016434989|nr:extracellular solute-binding protein [Nocardioides sp. zg-1228]MBC2932950.1 extracellular solute-binding protein [Nocardioides sp. zg-1228]QSF56849.1 extracellular solute-binding protein [Nocardioides sp. zg-1228]